MKIEEELEEILDTVREDTREERNAVKKWYSKANEFLTNHIVAVFFIVIVGVFSINFNMDIKGMSEIPTIKAVDVEKPTTKEIHGNYFTIDLDKAFVGKRDVIELKDEKGEVTEKLFAVWYREKEVGSKFFFTLREPINDLKHNKIEHTKYLAEQIETK